MKIFSIQLLISLVVLRFFDEQA